MNKDDAKKGFILTVLGGIAWGFSGTCGQYIFTKQTLVGLWPPTLPASGSMIDPVVGVAILVGEDGNRPGQKDSQRRSFSENGERHNFKKR